jgi:CDP-6-deoxy-D-xylo-4-hexulose-3-dehydrase
VFSIPTMSKGLRDTAQIQDHRVLRRREGIVSELGELIEQYFSLSSPDDPQLSCPLSVPLYGTEEVQAALEVLLSREVTAGSRVREFEQVFASFIGSKHAVMVNSGSSANLLAVSALMSQAVANRLHPGDEVIVPAVTWPTTVTPIIQNGCVPVFVDIDRHTLDLRPEDLERAFSPRTRAIFVVHLLGNPVAMDPVMRLASERDLWVLEDTCEALGTQINGRRAGAIGHVGTFSFYFSHHITTVEGGMLVTDDDELADVVRSMRAHGWTRDMSNRREIESASPWIDPRFLFVELGYNMRPMEVQAAFGLVQLRRLEQFNEARRRNARTLIAALSDIDEIELVAEQEGGRSTWFGFPVILKDAATRQALSHHLEQRRIETRPIVAGNLAVQPAFRDSPHRTVGSLANATAIGQCGLFVGNHPDLDERRLAHIVEGFRSFFAAP